MTLDEHIGEMLAAGGTDALVGFILGMSARNVALWRRARGIPKFTTRRARESAAISRPGRVAPGWRAGATEGPQPHDRPARLARLGRVEEGLGDFG